MLSSTTLTSDSDVADVGFEPAPEDENHLGSFLRYDMFSFAALMFVLNMAGSGFEAEKVERFPGFLLCYGMLIFATLKFDSDDVGFEPAHEVKKFLDLSFGYGCHSTSD